MIHATMAEEQEPIFLLAKEDLSHIQDPLKATQRIKFTCFNVSRNFLVFGATSGALYVFKRDPCIFLQLLPNKEGAVTHLSISPSEKFFAFATVKGTVCVLERNVGPGARLIQISREHRDTDVTVLQWNSENSELYIGDTLGRISVLTILMLISKNLFNMPSFMLMKLDSSIVQLDWQSNLLLVSTMTRCYVCNTFKEEFRQIGQKLRDGEFGACFFNVNNETGYYRSSARKEETGKFTSVSFDALLGVDERLKDVKLFCARPGARLWEADFNGAVRRTHELKHALAQTPTSLLDINDTELRTGDSHLERTEKSFCFSRLSILSNKYVLTYSKDGIYIFDPIKASVVLWNNDLKDIVGCQVFQDVLYVRLSTGEMHVLTLLSVENILIGLYLRENYILCAELCCQYLDYLIHRIASYPKLHLLSDLKEKIPIGETATTVSPFLQELLISYTKQQSNQRLKSGIFMVGNKFALLNNIQQEESWLSVDSATETSREKKVRSLDPSPERTADSTSKGLHRSSSCSDVQQALTELRNKPLPEKQDVEDSSEDDDYFNKELRDPFSLMTSSETIQAFKHFSNTVTDKFTTGTKSLKDTWHTLEDRVKHLADLSQDFPIEPFDIKFSNGQPMLTEEVEGVCNFEVMHTHNSMLSNQSKQVPDYPVLDLSQVISICDRLDETQLTIDDFNQLSFSLFQNIKSICHQFEQFCTTNEPKTATKWNRSPRRFPFHHYFSRKYTKIIQNILDKSLTSNVFVEYLKSMLLSVSSDHSKTPDFLFTIHSQQSLDIDYLLSIHLSSFGDLLDSVTIIDSIRRLEIPCYYLSLSQILQLYSDGVIPLSSDVEDGSSERLLPSLLNAMFWLLKMGQAETCLKMGKSVPLKEVLYLILRLQCHITKSGVDLKHALLACRILFLTYIENLNDFAVLCAALEDQELELYITNAFQCVNEGATNQSCTCGFPLPKAATTVLQFPNIGHYISNYYWTNNESQLYHLACKIPALWLNILQLRIEDDVINLLPLLLHIGDVTKLSDISYHFDRNVWEFTLDLFAEFQSGICLNCHKLDGHAENSSGITWTSLGLLMLQSLGAPTTLDLMIKFESQIPPGGLDLKFYQMCLLSSMTASSSNVRGVRPEVRNVTGKSDQLLTGTSLRSVVINVINDICPYCTLPLSLRSLLDDGGLTSFPCLHKFHTACLTKTTNSHCLLCTSL